MRNEFSTENGVPDIILEMAKISSEAILPHFRKPHQIENKFINTAVDGAEGFDPVTIADKNAEAVLRKLINERFPDHGILGEEYGGENLGAEYVWVLDPIDGTRAFVSGLPLWGTLIALCHEGRPILGAMIQPFLKEIFVGGGRHSWLAGMTGNAPATPLKTNSAISLKQATIFTTEPALFDKDERTYFDTLESMCRLHRYGLDCYGYAMVASGFGNLTVEAGLQIYDIAALIPLIESAGGRVTNWNGDLVQGLENQKRLRILASANDEIHAKALDVLNAQNRFRE